MYYGSNCLSFMIRIPSDLQSPHLGELQNLFKKTCKELIDAPHRASVEISSTKTNGNKYRFSITFGKREDVKKASKKMVEDLTNFSIWKLLSKVYENKAKSKFELCSKQYYKIFNGNNNEVISNHIKVKPNEHIKLC